MLSIKTKAIRWQYGPQRKYINTIYLFIVEIANYHKTSNLLLTKKYYCFTIQVNTIQDNTTIQYKASQYNTTQHNRIECNTIQYNTKEYIQYNTIQYINTVSEKNELIVK